jgi:ubiquitin-like domain-containing CTD phosphatase 1
MHMPDVVAENPSHSSNAQPMVVDSPTVSEVCHRVHVLSCCKADLDNQANEDTDTMETWTSLSFTWAGKSFDLELAESDR